MNNDNTISIDHTLIILDWDDTLFPTNWVIKNGINLSVSKTRDQYIYYFENLDIILSNLLHQLVKYGKVIIVTNAMPEWIKTSSYVLPLTHIILKKLKIISARALYQKQCHNIMEWKKLAFKNEVANELKNKNYINVISIGDAEYEYMALISLHDWNKKTNILKSIKFMKEPSHDVLIDQLKVLTDAIPAICRKNTHLDLKFNKYTKY